MTTWPNPAAPGVPENAGEPLTEAAWNGVPENPERDGWHLLAYLDAEMPAHPWRWNSTYHEWIGDIPVSPSSIVYAWHYLGPVYTAAQVEAARREGREEAKEACRAVQRRANALAETATQSPESRRAFRERAWSANTCREEIDALPTAPTPALDAVVQRAEQRVFEECAKIARRGLYVDREWLPKVPTEAEAYDSMREARAIESEIIRACAARTDRSGG